MPLWAGSTSPPGEGRGGEVLYCGKLLQKRERSGKSCQAKGFSGRFFLVQARSKQPPPAPLPFSETRLAASPPERGGGERKGDKARKPSSSPSDRRPFLAPSPKSIAPNIAADADATARRERERYCSDYLMHSRLPPPLLLITHMSVCAKGEVGEIKERRGKHSRATSRDANVPYTRNKKEGRYDNTQTRF